MAFDPSGHELYHLSQSAEVTKWNLEGAPTVGQREYGGLRQAWTMGTTPLTAASFQDTVRADGMVLVDWWASWCVPCRAFSPVFEAASEEHPDVVFATVDTEAEEALSAAAGIRSIPTLMAFRDGVLVYSQPGTLSADMLERLIAGIQSLDMDVVREQLAAQESGGAENPREV